MHCIERLKSLVIDGTIVLAVHEHPANAIVAIDAIKSTGLADLLQFHRMLQGFRDCVTVEHSIIYFFGTSGLYFHSPSARANTVHEYNITPYSMITS